MPFWKKFTSHFCLLFFLSSFTLGAQELNFTVSVNADQVNTTERGIFSEMETAFERFLNERVWTTDRFQNNEKIKGNIIITIQNQPSIGRFTANAQIQLIRPVYKSSYETPILNFADRDWDFQFTLGQPMNFNENNFQSNLTSLLAYYAFIALGMDYDSFSPLGGAPFYQKALNVVNNAGQGNGWGQFQNRRNRYWLLENLSINNQYEPVREAIYTYHREGLDIMRATPDKTRTNVLQALKDIQQVNRTLPNAILIISFLDAKSDELLNIFSDGPMNIRREAYNELLKLDPTRRSKYQKIVQN